MQQPVHNLPYSEQFRIVAKQWVDADAAASLLEELKTTTLEKIKTDIIAKEGGGMADNKAERLAKCSDVWSEYIRSMCASRSAANKLKVQMKYLEMRFQESQSAAATARAEMRL